MNLFNIFFNNRSEKVTLASGSSTTTGSTSSETKEKQENEDEDEEKKLISKFEKVGFSSEDLEEELYPYKILTTSEIMTHMLSTISEVNLILAQPPTITRILLNHFRWDSEKLLERYYEHENPSQLFKEAHIVDPATIIQSNEDDGACATVCKICYLDYPITGMVSSTCGVHTFCTDCWSAYLRAKIVEEGQGSSIACPGCDILLDDDTVLKFLQKKNQNSKVSTRYRQLITNSFVECNRLLRWCPSKGCDHVIKVEFPDFQPVKCICNTTFCFKCGHDWHYPLECGLLRQWVKKCAEDQDTFNWISANTKDCPKCGTPIEKNGGCNQMVCKNSNCKFTFCWLCLGKWSSHGYSACNGYKEAASTATDRTASLHQRYMFYSNRFVNHQLSLKYKPKLVSLVSTKVDQLQARLNMSWLDVQFLTTAVEVLSACRRILMYSYAFAYYLVSSNEVDLFKANQNYLEEATEELSLYLEREITDDYLVEIKQKVMNKSQYCEARRKAMLAHIKEGFEGESWLMRE